MSDQDTTTPRNRLWAFFCLVLALVLSCGMLVGCGSSGAEEQDNCYGDDMPVINE